MDYISRRTLDKLKLGFLKNRQIKGKSNGERPDKLTSVMFDTKLDPFQTIYKADFGKEGGGGGRREVGERREGEGGEEEGRGWKVEEVKKKKEGGRREGGWKEEGGRREGGGEEGMEGGWEEREKWEEEGDEQDDAYKKINSRGFKSERKRNLLNSIERRSRSSNRRENEENFTTPHKKANFSNTSTKNKPKMVKKTRNQASYSDYKNDSNNLNKNELNISDKCEPDFSYKNEQNFSNKKEPNFSKKNDPNLDFYKNEVKGDEGANTKNCEWASVEEGQLQDVLNSDVFRQMGVDPVSLIEENPDYFSHLFCKQQQKKLFIFIFLAPFLHL